MGRLALTGSASFLGGRLLRRLAEARGPEEVVAVDIAAPPAGVAVRFRELDLTEPAADQRLLDVFREEGVETVVHMAFFTSPRRDGSHAHELESIGTLGALAAAAAAGVRHFVLRSFTAVYGAHGQNPAFLTEDRPLAGGDRLRWVRDKVEAEHHAASFARRFPAMRVTVLRYAPLFGPGVHNFYTRLLDHRVVPVVMGYDPLVQLLHPEDALTATEAALERGVAGAFNVVPRQPIPLLTALHLAGKVPLPVPHPLAYAATDLLWSAGLSEAPGAFVDFARFVFMAAGDKAGRDLGFEARYTSRQALEGYQLYRHPAPARRGAQEPA